MNNSMPTAAASESFLAAERTLKLTELLDTTAVIRMVAATVKTGVKISACRVEHIRYHPQSSCSISYLVEYTTSGRMEPKSTWLYARAFDDEGYTRAQRQAEAMSWVAGALMVEPAPFPEQRAILYEFPNDARLAHLSELAQPKTIRAIMKRITLENWPGYTVSQRRLDFRLLRYKPESRCVLFCSADRSTSNGRQAKPLSVVLRTAKGDRVETEHRAMMDLYSRLPADGALRVPKPLLFDSTLQISAVEWVEGEKLSDLFKDGRYVNVLQQTSHALASLHRLEAPDSQKLEIPGLLRRSEDALALLETAIPARASQLQAIREEFRQTLAKGAAVHTAWIHGDFHQGQVLSDSGGVWFIDYGGTRVGEIEEDLGNFAAQLRWLTLQGRLPSSNAVAAAFFENYGEKARFMPDERRIRLWCAAGLIELAAKQYRRLKTNWGTTVPLLLSAAESELEKS